MSETIEDFVAKLQTDGVQAGQQQADEIRQAAQDEADALLAKAKADADKIIADAKTDAQNILQRGRTELKLASRDSAMMLRDALARAIEAVLRQATKETLEDPEFIGQLLHEIVLSYVKADQDSKTWTTISVAPELRDKLRDWALREIGGDEIESIRGRFDLKGTLSEAGFEYSSHGSTVEVTVDSVVEALSQLVSPKLRELLNEAMAEAG